MALDFFIFGPEGGDTTEMGTSVGPNMLERYPIFLQPEPVPGDPAQLILNSPPSPPPPAPSFAAPPAVRLQPGFGPVTPSGYAEPPMDPMSYYYGPTEPELSNVQTFTRPRVEQPTFGPVTPSGYAEPTPSPESYYGGDIRPELSNVSTVTRQPAQQPAAPASPKQTGGGGQAKTSPTEIWKSYNPDFHLFLPPANFGEPQDPDQRGYQWIWDKNHPEWGYWKPPATPPEGGVVEVDPEQLARLLEGQTPTTSTGTTGAPGTGSPTPENPILRPFPTSPTVVPQFTVTPPTYFEPEKPDGYFPIDYPSQPSTPRPVREIDYTRLNPLRTVPLPQRATDNFIPEPYKTPNYIQYDPEQILAAAMRAIGNQRIRQSIVDQAMENRMLERMRG